MNGNCFYEMADSPGYAAYAGQEFDLLDREYWEQDSD